MTNSANNELIDFSALQKYIASDPHVYMPLLQQFLASLVEQTQAVQAAFDNRNREELRRIAHQLHGSAGYYGAEQLRTSSAALQHVDANLDEAELVALYQPFHAALTALLAYKV